MRTRPSLDFTDAQAAAEACRVAAEAAAAKVSIAVVDDAGALLSFQRLDGARAYSVDLALRKARTAAAVCLPTRVIGEVLQGQPPTSAEMLALPGGLPVLSEGQCAGAIGVSGGTAEADEAIAQAGLAALSSAG